MGEGTGPDRTAVLAARADALAAREALGEELVRLEASARAAVDVKAKVKKHPVKAAGLVGGAAFLAVKGPKHVFRGAKRIVMGPSEPLPKAMLPDEIEKNLKRLGSDGDQVRGLLEREFATYLNTTQPLRRRSSFRGAATIAAIAFLRPLILGYSKKLAKDIFETEAPAYESQLDRVRERMTGLSSKKTDGDGGPDAGSAPEA
jgi:hypothetical protein